MSNNKLKFETCLCLSSSENWNVNFSSFKWLWSIFTLALSQGFQQKIMRDFFSSVHHLYIFALGSIAKIEYQILRLSLHFVHSFIHGILIFNHQISHDIAQVGESKRKISILQFSDTYSLDNNFLDLQFEQFYFSINTSEKQEN